MASFLLSPALGEERPGVGGSPPAICSGVPRMPVPMALEATGPDPLRVEPPGQLLLEMRRLAG